MPCKRFDFAKINILVISVAAATTTHCIVVYACNMYIHISSWYQSCGWNMHLYESILFSLSLSLSFILHASLCHCLAMFMSMCMCLLRVFLCSFVYCCIVYVPVLLWITEHIRYVRLLFFSFFLYLANNQCIHHTPHLKNIHTLSKDRGVIFLIL